MAFNYLKKRKLEQRLPMIFFNIRFLRNMLQKNASFEENVRKVIYLGDYGRSRASSASMRHWNRRFAFDNGSGGFLIVWEYSLKSTREVARSGASGSSGAELSVRSLRTNTKVQGVPKVRASFKTELPRYVKERRSLNLSMCNTRS